jgi:hypothetical protein
MRALSPSRPLAQVEKQYRGQTQHIENKRVRQPQDDETSASAGFSGIEKGSFYLLRARLVFLDPQLLYFRV